MVWRQRLSSGRARYGRGPSYDNALLKRTIEAYLSHDGESLHNLRDLLKRCKMKNLSNFLIETDIDRRLMDMISGMVRGVRL